MKKLGKNSLLFVLTSLMSFSFASCGPQQGFTKINIDYGHVRKSPLKSIDEVASLKYAELKNRIDNEESFILAVKSGFGKCDCWEDLQSNNLIPFMNEFNMDIFWMKDTDFEGLDKFELNLGGVMPLIAIARRGKFEIQKNYKVGDSTFKVYADFKNFVLSYVNVPKNIFKIDTDLLDTYIEENKTFNLYVGRNGCPDCVRIESSFLHDYNDRQVEFKNTLYYLDIEKYRGTESYQTLKDKYGLSVQGNATYGYNYSETKGFVPTFQHYTEGLIDDACVLLNDFVLKEDDQNKIKGTYFTQERVNNLKFIPDEEKADYVLYNKVLTVDEAAHWRVNVMYDLHAKVFSKFAETYYLK